MRLAVEGVKCGSAGSYFSTHVRLKFGLGHLLPRALQQELTVKLRFAGCPREESEMSPNRSLHLSRQPTWIDLRCLKVSVDQHSDCVKICFAP